MDIGQAQRKPPDLLLCKSCFRSCQSIKEFLLHKCTCVQYPHNCDLCDKNITSKIELEVHYQCWHNIPSSRSNNPNRFSTSTERTALCMSNPVSKVMSNPMSKVMSKVRPKSTPVPKTSKLSPVPTVKETNKELDNNEKCLNQKGPVSLTCVAERVLATEGENKEIGREKASLENSQDIVGALHGVAAALQPITVTTDTANVSSPETLRIIGVLKNVASALQPLLKANPAVRSDKEKDEKTIDNKLVKDAVHELLQLYKLLANGLKYVIVNDKELWEKNLPLNFTSLTLQVGDKFELTARPEQKDITLRMKHSPQSPPEIITGSGKKVPLPPLKGTQTTRDAKCLPVSQKSPKPISMVQMALPGGGKPTLPPGMVLVKCQEPMDFHHMQSVLPQGIPLVRVPGIVHQTHKSINVANTKMGNKVSLMPVTSQQVIIATPLLSTTKAYGSNNASTIKGLLTQGAKTLGAKTPCVLPPGAKTPGVLPQGAKTPGVLPQGAKTPGGQTPVVLVPSSVPLTAASNVLGKCRDSQISDNTTTLKSEHSVMFDSNTVTNNTTSSPYLPSRDTTMSTGPIPLTVSNGKSVLVTQSTCSNIKVVPSLMTKTPIVTPLPTNSVVPRDTSIKPSINHHNQTTSMDANEETSKKRKMQEDSNCNIPTAKYPKVEGLENKVKVEPIVSKSITLPMDGQKLDGGVIPNQPMTAVNVCQRNNSGVIANQPMTAVNVCQQNNSGDTETECEKTKVIVEPTQNGKTSCQGYLNTSIEDGHIDVDVTGSPQKDGVTNTRPHGQMKHSNQLLHSNGKPNTGPHEQVEHSIQSQPSNGNANIPTVDHQPTSSQRRGQSSQMTCQTCKTSLPILSEHYPDIEHVHRVEFGEMKTPYKCQECVYETSCDLSAFTHHYAVHHGGFKCPQCDLTCDDTNTLTNHITGNHLRRSVEV